MIAVQANVGQIMLLFMASLNKIYTSNLVPNYPFLCSVFIKILFNTFSWVFTHFGFLKWFSDFFSTFVSMLYDISFSFHLDLVTLTYFRFSVKADVTPASDNGASAGSTLVPLRHHWFKVHFCVEIFQHLMALPKCTLISMKTDLCILGCMIYKMAYSFERIPTCNTSHY